MASMPQWELPHTKVEQAHRTVGLQYKDFHICVKNQELIFSAVSFVCFDIPLQSRGTGQLIQLLSVNQSSCPPDWITFHKACETTFGAKIGKNVSKSLEDSEIKPIFAPTNPARFP